MHTKKKARPLPPNCRIVAYCQFVPAVALATSGATTLTHHGHMQGNVKMLATGGSADDYGPLLYRTPVQPALDGNNGDLDTKQVQFADNLVRFELLVTDVLGQIKSLLAPIPSGG